MPNAAVLTIPENCKRPVASQFSCQEDDHTAERGGYEDVSDHIDGKNQRPLERVKREAR